jgi:hypothetical protein
MAAPEIRGIIVIHGVLLFILVAFLVWVVPWFNEYFGMYDW